MIPLSEEEINLRSNYRVRLTNELAVDFETDYGVVYGIEFMKDYSIWDDNAYQLVIINRNKRPSPNDDKLRQTIFTIIEEFFRENPSILLYICETGDGKQAARNRLFVQWVKTYEGANRMYFEDAEVVAEGVVNYAALIIERTNPQLNDIIETFKSIIEMFNSKPV